MKHKGFVRVIINSFLIIIIASIIGFTTGYMITPSTVIPINLLRKFTGEDGKVYYKIMLSKDYSTVVADSSLTTGGNGTSGDNTSGDNSGTGENPSVTPSTPITNHQHVSYRQGNYTQRLYNDTIARSGCGLCSFSAMMAEAGYGNGMDPAKWLEYFDNKGTSIRNYWVGDAMQWSFPVDLPKILNNDGSFGHWELCGSVSNGSSPLSRSQFKEFVTQHLADGDYIMASSNKGLFTNNKHIIMIIDFADEEHTSMHICDSNSVVSQNLFGSYDGWSNVNKFNFPIDSDSPIAAGWNGNNESSYHIKALWALKHTN